MSTASLPGTGPVTVPGTTLSVHALGTGPPLLLVHGGGEDASMLADQAASLAAAGFHVITYDRRGTGGSGRDDWPGSGANQHADDAAALLGTLGHRSAVVVGVSSGALIALDLAVRHPALVEHVVAWEPPALGLLPDAAAQGDDVMAPVQAHLAAHPGDYVGAQAILLSAILDFPVEVDDPAFAPARANAEPMIRDEPTIALVHLDPAELRAMPSTVVVGTSPNDVVAAAVRALTEITGREPVTVDADHEVYLSDPAVLTDVVRVAAGRVMERQVGS